MAFVVAGGFALRLSGFQLRVGNGVLASRDGFFRTQSCRVSEIRSLDLQWVEQRWLWKRTSKLRIVITLINGRSLQINPKPFNSKSIATLQSLIHTSATR